MATFRRACLLSCISVIMIYKDGIVSVNLFEDRLYAETLRFKSFISLLWRSVLETCLIFQTVEVIVNILIL